MNTTFHGYHTQEADEQWVNWLAQQERRKSRREPDWIDWAPFVFSFYMLLVFCFTNPFLSFIGVTS